MSVPVSTCQYYRPVESLRGPLSDLVTCRADRAAAPRGGRAPGRGAGWHRTCSRSVQPPCATAGGDAWRAGWVPQRPGAPCWRGGVHRPFEFPIRLSYGNERWELNERGVMRRRAASINDVSRAESDRQGFWPAPSPRLADHPGIPDVESPGCLIPYSQKTQMYH